METHHTGNPWIYLEVKRSKVKVTRPINAGTDNVLANNTREAKREGCCIERDDDDLAPTLGQVGELQFS